MPVTGLTRLAWMMAQGELAQVCAPEDVPAVLNPLLAIIKVATEANFDAVGDVIHYTIVATNVGNVTLPVVTVTDPLVNNLICIPANGSALAVGASLDCSATHTVTQADLNAGHWANTACVDDGAGGATQVCAPEDVPAVQNRLLAITKVATEANFDAVGDVIHYTIIATNVGNVTLPVVTVTDPLVSNLTCTPANGSALAPTASLNCSATHTVTQADLNAGHWANTACVDDGAGGATQVCAPEDVPAVQNRLLSITKVATEANFDAVNDVIHYTIIATNVGNVTLPAVTVTDPLVSNLICTPANGSARAPGASLNCTATHTVTQADLNAGHWANTACVDDGAGGATQVCAPEDVPAVQNRLLSITKVATEANFDALGDVIHYTIVATNVGNVTLPVVTVTDPLVSDLICIPANGSARAPGASLNCTATHTVTQADLNAGHWANTACVDDGAGGATQVCAPEDVPAVQNPALALSKTASPTVYDYEGQVISYSYVITNTGNVTISAPFTVVDNKTTNETCPSPPTFLLPSQFITCSASYTIKKSDMTNGTVTNVANATGKFGASTITSNTDTVTVIASHILTYNFLPIVLLPYPPEVQVLPVSFNYESHGKLYIIGEVLNNTTNPITWVKVVANLFDADDKLLGTANNFMWPVDLPALEKGCFKISMPIPIPPSIWSYYQFESLTYDISNTSPGLSIINNIGSLNPDQSYTITGQVRNNGNQRSNDVSVSGTLYNIHGEPVGCELSLVASTDLNPGQVSSFQIRLHQLLSHL